MIKSLFLIAVGVLHFWAKAQSNDTGFPIRNEAAGKAEIVFGTVKGEEQVIQMSGTRKIAGIYPHLTTYSQSRKDGR